MEDKIVDDYKSEIEDILDSQPYHFLTRGLVDDSSPCYDYDSDETILSQLSPELCADDLHFVNSENEDTGVETLSPSSLPLFSGSSSDVVEAANQDQLQKSNSTNPENPETNFNLSKFLVETRKHESPARVSNRKNKGRRKVEDIFSPSPIKKLMKNHSSTSSSDLFKVHCEQMEEINRSETKLLSVERFLSKNDTKQARLLLKKVCQRLNLLETGDCSVNRSTRHFKNNAEDIRHQELSQIREHRLKSLADKASKLKKELHTSKHKTQKSLRSSNDIENTIFQKVLPIVVKTSTERFTKAADEKYSKTSSKQNHSNEVLMMTVDDNSLEESVSSPLIEAFSSNEATNTTTSTSNEATNTTTSTSNEATNTTTSTSNEATNTTASTSNSASLPLFDDSSDCVQLSKNESSENDDQGDFDEDVPSTSTSDVQMVETHLPDLKKLIDDRLIVKGEWKLKFIYQNILYKASLTGNGQVISADFDVYKSLEDWLASITTKTYARFDAYKSVKYGEISLQEIYQNQKKYLNSQELNLITNTLSSPKEKRNDRSKQNNNNLFKTSIKRNLFRIPKDEEFFQISSFTEEFASQYFSDESSD